jgi:hypothetical protein
MSMPAWYCRLPVNGEIRVPKREVSQPWVGQTAGDDASRTCLSSSCVLELLHQLLQGELALVRHVAEALRLALQQAHPLVVGCRGGRGLRRRRGRSGLLDRRLIGGHRPGIAATRGGQVATAGRPHLDHFGSAGRGGARQVRDDPDLPLELAHPVEGGLHARHGLVEGLDRHPLLGCLDAQPLQLQVVDANPHVVHQTHQ